MTKEPDVRILLSEFRQESNSLAPATSDLEFWRRTGWILEPDEVRARLAGGGSALAGMIDLLDAASGTPAVEVVFGPSMYAQSGGTAEQSVLEHFWGMLRPALEENLPLDGVFLSLHGALQTTEHDDAEAEVLRRIRSVVGEECVLAVSTDLHGYVSAGFAERADVICGYHTYPHIDFRETGERAAALGLQAIVGTPPVMAWTPIPMMVSASAYNSLGGPFAELIGYANGLVAAGSIRDYSIYQMQPWLDVARPNSTAIVIADDESTALHFSADLAARLYARRHDFEPALQSIDAVIDLALDPTTPKPVILVDSADSNNAGAPGDSMAVAARLLARTDPPRSATVVSDRAAALRAHELGVGATAEFTIGGQADPHAPRITASGYVRSLHDGSFRPEGVGSAGAVIELGQAAVIRFGTLDVLVCDVISGNGDPQLYRAFGIEPTLYDLVVVKANTSFRAGYSAFAGLIVDADTPGAAASTVAELPFERLTRDLYPWVDEPFTPSPQIFRSTAQQIH
ncbi:M81 family metallopeptidase [Herbiconiux sp. P16]|uniref:M81 family metallopeptidase n=1 Tax=Herbiconiux wuyangfengii TaxID=3342794 RepID=UPI0035BB6F52